MRWVWDSVKFIYNWPDSDQLMTHSVLDLFLVVQYICHRTSLYLSLSLGRTQRCPSMNAPTRPIDDTHRCWLIKCLLSPVSSKSSHYRISDSWENNQLTLVAKPDQQTFSTTNGRELCRTSPIENRNLIFLSNLEQVHTLSRIIVIRQVRSDNSFRSAWAALFYHGLLINFFMLWGHSFYRQFHWLSHLYFRVIEFRFVR